LVVLIQDGFRDCSMSPIFFGSPGGLLTSKPLTIDIHELARSRREPDNRCEIVLKGKKGRH
jgi:hypothetical protein